MIGGVKKPSAPAGTAPTVGPRGAQSASTAEKPSGLPPSRPVYDTLLSGPARAVAPFSRNGLGLGIEISEKAAPAPTAPGGRPSTSAPALPAIQDAASMTVEGLAAEAAKALALGRKDTSGVSIGLPTRWARREVGVLATDLGATMSDVLEVVGAARDAGLRAARAYDPFIRLPSSAFTRGTDGALSPSPAWSAAHTAATAETKKELTTILERLRLPTLERAIGTWNALPKAEQAQVLQTLAGALESPHTAKLSDTEKTLAFAVAVSRTAWASAQGPRALVGQLAGHQDEAARVDPSKRPSYRFTAELVKALGAQAGAELFKSLEPLGATWAG